MLKKILKPFVHKLQSLGDTSITSHYIRQAYKILNDEYIHRHLYENPKYKNTKRLNQFEYRMFSQNGEDGIIEEIFNRIGTTNKIFVEFGAGGGIGNNTTALLLQHWSGYWIEGNPVSFLSLKKRANAFILQKSLVVKQSMITAENIEALFQELQIPEEFDLLSIDIDGNDYWVWKAIQRCRPRVVVIEYNAAFRANVKWVMKYNPQSTWKKNNYFGASLKSLENLGIQKDYYLVGCNFTGVNAFFVRKDMPMDKFLEPFTSENHWEPIRPFLISINRTWQGLEEFESI